MKLYPPQIQLKISVVFLALAAVMLLLLCLGLTACDKDKSLWQTGELKMHFLSVGQGDCTLLELPDGKKVMIDGGDGQKENDVCIENYLKTQKIKKLDYVILTHADQDHYGGLENVLNQVEVSYVYLPRAATLSDGDGYFSLYQAALKEALNVHIFERYNTIAGENYFLTFLWPQDFVLNDRQDTNYSSAVIWLDYLGTSALFTGDMSQEIERQLMREYALDPTIFNWQNRAVDITSTEILKVSHHGSASASSLEWLELLNFRTAVISCGVNNEYGHPSAATLENLRAASPNGQIYRTDECGNIIITVRKEGGYDVTYQNQTDTAAVQADELASLFYVKQKLYGTEDGTI